MKKNMGTGSKVSLPSSSKVESPDLSSFAKIMASQGNHSSYDRMNLNEERKETGAPRRIKLDAEKTKTDWPSLF